MDESAALYDLFARNVTVGSDTFFCQHQRPALEQRGITFAPVEIAAAFSWESNIEEVPGDRPNAFGFHNFNLEHKKVPRA